MFTKTVVCAYCPTVTEAVFWSPEFLSEMLDELSLIFFFLPRLHTDGLTAESTLRIKWMFNLNLLSLPWFYFRTQTMFHRFPIISKDILSNIFFFTTLKGNKPEPLVWLVICFRYHCWKNRDISDLFHLTECWHLVGEQILVNIKSNDTAKTNHV